MLTTIVFRDGNWVPADKFENPRAKRKLFTWIFCCGDLTLNVSSTGPHPWFPPKHVCFICWPPSWMRPRGFAPSTSGLSPISYFYSMSSEPMYSPDVCVHVSPTAMTAHDTTTISLPDPSLPTPIISSRTSSRISSHFITSSHFSIPGGKTGTKRSTVNGTGRFQLTNPGPQTLSQRKCAVTNNERLNSRVTIVITSIIIIWISPTSCWWWLM